MSKTENQQATSEKLKYSFAVAKGALKRLFEKINIQKSAPPDLNIESYDQLEAKRSKYTLRRDLF
jgi:hypothetical protein